MEKTIDTSQLEFVIIILVELSKAHLLKKSRFYHLPMPRYMQNTKCCKTFGTSGIYLYWNSKEEKMNFSFKFNTGGARKSFKAVQSRPLLQFKITNIYLKKDT